MTWAIAAPTVLRLRLGEGVLFPLNCSILWYQMRPFGDALAAAVVSLLALVAMYAFNDLYDAADDRHNPRKDQQLVRFYLDHASLTYALAGTLHMLTIILAAFTLGRVVALSVTAVLAVNLVYSVVLKGVPLVDVLWCGIWGATYASIASSTGSLIVTAGLMTAVCHLYQAEGDRISDAASGITTTAVFSRALSYGLLFALSAGLALILRSAHLGPAALMAFVPFGLFLLVPNSRVGWMLTKMSYIPIWLMALEQTRAIG